MNLNQRFRLQLETQVDQVWAEARDLYLNRKVNPISRAEFTKRRAAVLDRLWELERLRMTNDVMAIAKGESQDA